MNPIYMSMAIAAWFSSVGALRLLSQIAERDPLQIKTGFCWLVGGAVWLFILRLWGREEWEKQERFRDLAELARIENEKPKDNSWN